MSQSRHRRQSRLVVIALCLAGVGSARAQVIAPNLLYTSIQPCRLIDTQLAGGALAAGVTRTFNAVGVNGAGFLTSQGGNPSGCPIPGFASGAAQVQAIVVNFVAVGAAGPGDLVAWPSDKSRPQASIVNYASQSALSGLNIANAIILPVRQDAQGNDISVLAQVAGTHLVADVEGYFTSESVVQSPGAGNLFLGAQNPGNPSVTTGVQNTGLGLSALTLNTTGSNNAAIGAQAMLLNETGSENTAVGASALANFTGTGNTATGFQALNSNTSDFSTALGWKALQHGTGTRNTAVGAGALQNVTSGTENIAVGVNAGGHYNGSETNNIILGGEIGGVAGENYVTRIGPPDPPPCNGSPGCGGTYISHIWGYTASGDTPLSVYVDINGLLGTTSSSRRFKEDIEDMGEASADLMRLRPVTFHFNQQHDNGSRVLQYGLIAEEVEQVYPGLVAHDKDGQPYSVHYQFVDAMLLNEVQKQHAKIEGQAVQIDSQRAEIATLLAHSATQRSEVEALRGKSEAERAASQTALSDLATRVANLEKISGRPPQ